MSWYLEGCSFEWEIFRGEDSAFMEDEWKFDKALLLNPGKNIFRLIITFLTEQVYLEHHT